MKFSDQIRVHNNHNKYLCVGLDPDLEKLPESCKNSNTPYLDFNMQIIDQTADLVCAYKPQFAHYAAKGKEVELEQTIKYIKDKYPDVPVILDSKRGDIGSTAKYYAIESFERYGADATTLNPYLGFDSIEPYLDWEGKGLIILCKTSNPGSGLLQDQLMQNGDSIYVHIAKTVDSWKSQGDFSLVVGGTHPECIEKIREAVPEMLFLVPGIGAQGGDLEKALKFGKNKSGSIIINSSRGIIYAGQSNDFAEKARQAVQLFNKTVLDI